MPCHPRISSFTLLSVTGGLLFLLLGASCSTYSPYTGPAAGGGYYVSPLAPGFLIPKPRRPDWVRVPDFISRFGGFNDGSFWHADDVRGSPTIVINLGEQMVYLHKGGQVVGGSPISSGREGYGTTTGNFRVSEKDIDHKSSLYGDYVDADGNVLMREIDVRKDRRPPGAKFDGANMRYFLRINGAIGMHEGYLPGYPASHGCIRLPGHMAEKFYHAVRVGTPVKVIR